MLARMLLILLGTIVSLTAYAQPKLATFVEANGCKLLSAERAITRLKEIAAQGTVVWDGRCKGGLIDGKGVLREEGALTVDGKTKKFAYFLSGTARKGLREGRWKRETFEWFVGSQKFYTSAALLNFVDGNAKGRPKLVSISHLDQFSPKFRQLVIEAQREAKPANEALLTAAIATPAVAPSAAVAPTLPSPAPTSHPPTTAATSSQLETPSPRESGERVGVRGNQKQGDAPSLSQSPQQGGQDISGISDKSPAVAVAPATADVSAIRITASSQLLQFGPEGLLAATQPGWHSANPPDYPEWIMMDFGAPRDINSLSLLAQDSNQDRAPRVIRIESSPDGTSWTSNFASEIPCAPNSVDGWLKLKLRSPATNRYLKLVILANCGNSGLVTLRGLRFE